MSALLNQYIPLVHFLGEILGNTTEVVLQDCLERQCIIAIANKEITGRDVGSPLTDLSLKIISEESWHTQSYLSCYDGQSKSGHALQCSTFFIKDGSVLHGMLCINRDVTIPTQLLSDLEAYLSLGSHITGNTAPAKYTESFSSSLSDMVQEVMEEFFGKDYSLIINRLTQEDRILIVRRLEEKQVFLLKGAVGEVASMLNCSEASIYRYLSKLQRQSETL